MASAPAPASGNRLDHDMPPRRKINLGREARKALARGLLGRKFEIHERVPHLIDFLRARDIQVVIDVGANVGQFGQSLRKAGYQGQITSIEPVAASFAELSVAAAASTNWTVLKTAVGAHSGTVEIAVSQSSVFSSIKPVTEAAAQFGTMAATQAVETVPLDTLDHLFPNAGPDHFLKIDIQGYEEEALKGATRLLSRIGGVQLELPSQHIYKDVWSMGTAIEWMERAGFRMAQMTPVNYSRDDPTTLLEVDCVFCRV